MAEINIWKPDSKLGSEGRKSHVKINIAADMRVEVLGGVLLPALENPGKQLKI